MTDFDQYRILTADQMVFVEDFLPAGILDDIDEARFQVLHEMDEDQPFVRRTRLQIQHDGLDALLVDLMQSRKMQKLVARWTDHAWRCVASQAITAHETFMSIYQPGDSFSWHTDHQIEHRILAWFLPLNEPGGGELTYTRVAWDLRRAGKPPCGPDQFKHFPPKRNRMLIMPAWVPHRSQRAKRTRRLLHGHFIA